jgi:methyl-accepting chemotaxis protein
LSEATRSIGDIVDSVKDLADQSNILALNASIEATRAGEMGKGFALVAREVRALADGSLQATQRAREKMAAVSRSIEQAVLSTKNSLPRVETGLQEAQRSGETLRSLAGISKKNADMVGQIASAVEQQNAGISQIAGAVTDQNEMMGRSVESLKAIQESLRLLQRVFASVNGVVLQYKV